MTRGETEAGRAGGRGPGSVSGRGRGPTRVSAESRGAPQVWSLRSVFAGAKPFSAYLPRTSRGPGPGLEATGRSPPPRPRGSGRPLVSPRPWAGARRTHSPLSRRPLPGPGRWTSPRRRRDVRPLQVSPWTRAPGLLVPRARRAWRADLPPGRRGRADAPPSCLTCLLLRSSQNGGGRGPGRAGSASR